MNNKAEEILNNLTQIATELQLIVDSKQVDSQEVLAREWLDYHAALEKVQQAIAQLQKLDVSTTTVASALTEAPPKKGLLAALREIQIEGEPDWSQRHDEIL